MATLHSFAAILRNQLAKKKATQEFIRNKVGISRRTLTNVLSGTSDYKITTLLAIADRLDLEVVLLPKEAARALDPDLIPTAPKVVSTVQAALDRIQARPGSLTENSAK